MAENVTSAGSSKIRVTIDHELCSGTGHCERGYPEVFVVADRKAFVRGDADWGDIDPERLKVAERTCPWFAISVET